MSTEKKHEDLEEYLVKESFVPTHHDQHQAKKMVVMRRRKIRAAKKEASLFSIFCAWVVEYQLGMKCSKEVLRSCTDSFRPLDQPATSASTHTRFLPTSTQTDTHIL